MPKLWICFICFLLVYFKSNVYAEIVQLSNDGSSTYIIDENNILWGSGAIYRENKDMDGVAETSNYPTVIDTDVRKIKQTNYGFFKLKTDGSLYPSGLDSYENVLAQALLGQGDKDNGYIPTLVMTDVKDFTVGDIAVAAVKNDNSLWVWGRSGYFTGGSGDFISNKPMKVMENVDSVYEGTQSWLIKLIDERWMTSGMNDLGQFGNGSIDCTMLAPISVSYPFEIMEVVEADKVIDAEGNLWIWGIGFYDIYSFIPVAEDNLHSENGVEFSTKPILVERNVKSFKQSADGIYILKSNGMFLSKNIDDKIIAENIEDFRLYEDNLICLDKEGNLFLVKNNDFISRELILSDVKQIWGDRDFQVFVEKNDGSLWAFGFNIYGSLGVGVYTRQIDEPMQNLYNVETTSETTTEITTESITEAPKKTITESKTLYVLSAIAVFGGVMFCIFKVRGKE